MNPSGDAVTHRVVLAAGAVVVERGRLLLARRGHEPDAGKWSLPGGRLESGETIATCVIRELREETGLVGAVNSLLGTTVLPGATTTYVVSNLRCRVLGGRLAPSSDATEVAFFPRRAVLGLDLSDGLRDWLDRFGILDDLD